MRTFTLAVLLSAGLALAACSKSTQEKTGDDLKAVGADAKAAVKDVADAPAVKDLGADLKAGTKEAAAKTKDAADEAGDKLKSGTEHAAAKTDAALDHAKDKVEH